MNPQHPVQEWSLVERRGLGQKVGAEPSDRHFARKYTDCTKTESPAALRPTVTVFQLERGYWLWIHRRLSQAETGNRERFPRFSLSYPPSKVHAGSS